MKNEIWKDVPSYEGLYKVSSLGRVKSLRRIDKMGRNVDEKILKLSSNGKGYLFISLNKDGLKKRFYVHRLVAKAFLPNPKNKPQVNHKDFDKSNNNIENIEWCTPSENNIHRYKYKKSPLRGRGGESHHNNKMVLQIDCFGNVISNYPSISIASKLTKTSLTSISQCCNGRRNKAGGYKWKYV